MGTLDINSSAGADLFLFRLRNQPFQIRFKFGDALVASKRLIEAEEKENHARLAMVQMHIRVAKVL